MRRVGRKYAPDEILPRVVFGFRCPRQQGIENGQVQDLDGDWVNFASLRLQTFFRSGISCVTCGIQGAFFIKELHLYGKKQEPSFPPHLNLYALDAEGGEVLMTKDHIVPKSKGGPDDLKNLQSMCLPCNVAKDNGDTLEEKKKQGQRQTAAAVVNRVTAFVVGMINYRKQGLGVDKGGWAAVGGVVDKSPQWVSRKTLKRAVCEGNQLELSEDGEKVRKTPEEKLTTRTSKWMSWALRHNPDKAGFTLDEQGWASVEDLLEKSPVWLTRKRLKRAVGENDKQRFEVTEGWGRIRARQGHSVPVDLGLEVTPPPEFLYHGTYPDVVKLIEANGLNKQQRHHVHLSTDEETATKVGARRGRPVIFRVQAGAMFLAGIEFFVTGNNVWLTDHVPPKYLTRTKG